MVVSQKIEHKIAINSTFGSVSKTSGNRSCKDIWTPKVTAELYIIANIQKQPKCPLANEWIQKCGIHRIEYYSAFQKKKKGNSSIYENMDEPEGQYPK